jgi:hypothetical protein
MITIEVKTQESGKKLCYFIYKVASITRSKRLVRFEKITLKPEE